MKKIITFLAIVGMFSFQGCTTTTDSNYVDNDTIPEAFEIKGVYLGKVSDNEYNYSSTFQKEIGGNLFDDETVLVYRLTDLINSTTPVWQLIPRTIKFTNGDVLEYYFDFSKIDFVITVYGNYNLLDRLSYIDNQTFRVVILPSNLASSINTNNYLEVMNALNLKENQIQKINF
jgi:hypothetical protein